MGIDLPVCGVRRVRRDTTHPLERSMLFRLQISPRLWNDKVVEAFA